MDPPGADSFLNTEEEILQFNGWRLPHWRQQGVTYFTTFRLADSIPQEVLAEGANEREVWREHHPKPWSEAASWDYHNRFPKRLQHLLDAGHGSCVLRLAECKKIVTQALTHFDGARYRLGGYVVAPNHVHALVTPEARFDLSRILHSWKSFTAHELVKLPAVAERLQNFWEDMGGHRTLWQKESYDHIVRDEVGLARIEKYIDAHR